MASHHEWWAYGSSENQYFDSEELSSVPVSLIPDPAEVRMKKIKRKMSNEQISLEVYFPGLSNNRNLLDKVRKTCRSLSLDYSISGNVLSVSGYPSSEYMDENYVFSVFEAIDDRVRLAS